MRCLFTGLWTSCGHARIYPVHRPCLPCRALACFKPSTFSLVQLPPAAKQGLVVPAKLIATPADAAKTPEQLLSYVPGESSAG